MTVSIDWTISVGNILTISVIMFTIVAAYFKLMGRVDRVEDRFTDMTKTMERMGETIIEIGVVLAASKVIEHRLDRAENDIREIKHGEGFVFPLGRVRPPEPGGLG